ncbi:PDZ and LIM domain protein 7 isoform X2 [Phlebotomus argentipes]|uniref:PDZ and LIM domain protein 7 isoform X2 n=1 Tax=Phlebotomus argentipes TaxID=94469 RepID=UPI002892BC30|nr:PDZ and LIM domain protein 7 isoform X2 [Phlebotomus argentipes]
MPEEKCLSIHPQESHLQEIEYGEEHKWGFQITGGADFGMPITIFHVSEGGQASGSGIKLGDTITKINNMDTSEMSLAEANAEIQATDKEIQLSVKSFEDDQEQVGEERDVTLKAKKGAEAPRKKSMPQLEQPKEQTWIPQPERKVWHPIVWQQPPPPVAQESYGPDAPHKRIIRNIRRLLNETEDQPEERWKHIENMLLALPTASKN